MADGSEFRVAPHNIEAEQALLGAILINNEALDRVADFLDPLHFFDPLHCAIYETASTLITSGQRATPVTMRNFFLETAPVGEITAVQYLARLASNAAAPNAIADYARAIVESSGRRTMIALAQSIIARATAKKADDSLPNQIADAEDQLMRLNNTTDGQLFEFSETVTRTIASINDAYQRGGGLAGLSTGYRSLDAKIGGMGPGDLIVLAGASSMGKSALAVNIAENVATAEEPKWVGIFSQEMSDTQIGVRVIARNAGIPANRLRTGSITEDEFRTVAKGAEGLTKARLAIDVTGGLSLARLAAKARRMARKHDIGLFVVDYLQLMGGSSGSYVASRNLQIGEITTGLKALAKELKVPIILLSQLNRENAKRENKRPQLGDLRDSGQIEQDADVVMFVHRPEYYLQREEPKQEDVEKYSKWQIEMAAAHGMAEIIFAKLRQAETGIVVMKYDGPTMTFSDERAMQ